MKNRNPNPDVQFLNVISGARLTSVNFVIDYVILGFDDRGWLTLLLWPSLFVDGNLLAFGEVEYRNKLCDQISVVVDRVEADGERNMVIHLVNEAQIRLHLGSPQSFGEKASFLTPDRQLQVWS